MRMAALRIYFSFLSGICFPFGVVPFTIQCSSPRLVFTVKTWLKTATQKGDMSFRAVSVHTPVSSLPSTALGSAT